MLRLILLLTTALSICTVQAKKIEIRIGSYHFPPYANHDQPTNLGLTTELIKELNNIQKKFKFVEIRTTAQKRYQDFENSRFDGVFFESKKWGWSHYKDLKFVKKILLDGEVFIARKLSGRTQDYFKTLKDKKLAAFKGYHYKFANFNSDEEFLKSHFNIDLSHSHLENIRKVKENKADMAIVTYTFLKKFLNDHPSLKDDFIISANYDQRYVLQFAIKESKKIDLRDFSILLNKALRSKQMKTELRKYNLN